MKKFISIIFVISLSALISAPVSSAQTEEFIEPVVDPIYIDYYYPYEELLIIDPYLIDAPYIIEPIDPIEPVVTPEDPYIDPYYPPEEEYIPPEEEYYPPEETPETGTAAAGTDTTDSTGTGLFIPGIIDTRPLPEDTPENIPEEEPEEEKEPEVIILQPKYPHPVEVINRVIPQITQNQLNIILIILIGVAAGTLVWIITGYIINSTQANRDTKRSNRQTAYSIHNQKMDQLKESYNKINDSIAKISETISSKSQPTKQELDAFKKASVELELFGSDETVKAQKNLANLLTQTKAPTQKEYNSAKNDLLQSLKQDLGI